MDSKNKIVKLTRIAQLSENERSITLKNWQTAKEMTQRNDAQLSQLKNYLQNYTYEKQEGISAGFYANHQGIIGKIREGIVQQAIKLTEAKKTEHEQWEKYLEANKKCQTFEKLIETKQHALLKEWRKSGNKSLEEIIATFYVKNKEESQ